MNRIVNTVLICCLFIFAIAVTGVYVSKESFLYPCDLVEYNLFWHDYSKLLVSDFPQFCSKMISDVYNLNRNPFLIIPLIPFFYIIKGFRFSFILASEIVYVIPSLLLIFKIINDNFIKLSEKSFLTRFLVYSSVCFIPAIWLPVFKGIPDIAGMVPMLIAFVLWFKSGLNSKTPVKKILLISFLLWFAFLLRRWYSIVIFAFLSSVVIENTIDIVLSNKERTEKIKAFFFDISRIVLCGLFVLIFAAIFQFKYITDLRLSDQLDIFKVDFNQWAVCVNNVGWFVMFFTLIAVIFLIKNKNVRFVFFNAFIYIFTFIVLMDNQFLWINHYVFPACMIAILLPVGLVFVSDKLKKPLLCNIFSIVIISLSCGNFVNAFFVEIPQIYTIYSKSDSKPYYNGDFEVAKDIYSFLKSECAENENAKITFWGLNTSVGYHQFRSFVPDDDFARLQIPFEIVEDRDLRGDEYDADYVILLEPHGFYSDDKYIQMMLYTIEQFNNGTGLAQNYELVKEAELHYNGDAKIKIYKRIQPFDENQISEYKSKLYEIRPDLKSE